MKTLKRIKMNQVGLESMLNIGQRPNTAYIKSPHEIFPSYALPNNLALVISTAKKKKLARRYGTYNRRNFFFKQSPNRSFSL